MPAKNEYCKSETDERNRGDNGSLLLPQNHGLYDDQEAPLGSGIAVLLALGGAYLVGKRRKDD